MREKPAAAAPAAPASVPLRILVVAACPFPAGRGSQLLVERTTRALIGRGHRVEVVAHRFGESGRTAPFRVHRAGLPRLGRPIASRPDPYRVVDDALLLAVSLRHRPDVILGHNVEGGLVAGVAGRALGAPAVYFRHSAFGEELAYRGALPWMGRAIGRNAERVAMRLCGHTLQLGSHALPSRARAWVLPPPADPDEARVEPADGRTLYYEGNRDPYQNPRWLEVALEAARGVVPGARLIVGRGPADRPRQADLALVPRSLPGGFPMKLLAYQVAGIPAVCVASAAPGLRDGEDAFVVPGRGSPQAFARRVAEAMGDAPGRARLRERARTRALARNDPAEIGRRLEAVLVRVSMAAR